MDADDPTPEAIFESLCAYLEERNQYEVADIARQYGLPRMAEILRHYAICLEGKGVSSAMIEAFFDAELWKDFVKDIYTLMSDPKTWLFIRFLYDARMYGVLGEENQ